MGFNISPVSITLGAGAERDVNQVCDLIHVFSSSLPLFEIKVNGGHWFPLAHGMKLLGQKFKDIRIRNTDPTNSLDLMLLIASTGHESGLRIEDQRPATNQLSIFGVNSVTGQPLIRDGGSAQEVREDFSYYWANNAAAGAAVVDTIVASGLNTMGVFVHMGDIEKVDNTNAYMKLEVCNADGSNRRAFLSTRLPYECKELTGSFLVGAGLELQAVWADGASGEAQMSYEVL